MLYEVITITQQKAYLLTDFRYTTQAAEQAKEFEVVKHAPVVTDTVKELLATERINRLGFEEDNVVYSTYRSYMSGLAPCELVPVRNNFV